MASPSLFLFFLLLFSVTAPISHSSFLFHGFNNSDLLLDEASTIESPGVLRLTNRSQSIIGHAFYPDAIDMFNQSSDSFPNASSFSTSFVFAIVPTNGIRGGFGFAFTLAPAPRFPNAQSEHFLGLFNPTNDGEPENHVIAVEFDTVNGAYENDDNEGNHVGINNNTVRSIASETAGYHVENSSNKEDVILESGKLIQAWIDYDGAARCLNVTIVKPLTIGKPSKPLISYFIDISPYLKEKMYVGFSASTGEKSSYHYILGWSFAVNGPAPFLNISKLPELPIVEENPPSFKFPIKILLGALSGAIVVCMAFILWLYKRKNHEDDLEDWELDCPRRFSYRDLYTATQGFRDSEIIGVGGFGAVYRGILRSTGSEIAVKKMKRNSIQGLREFAAEIESLGRLRHKNLVNLQGWCKKENILLIVYDYIPNGSLDFLLYKLKNNFVLNWEQRFNIIKGIAAGLLYLHEEWEQIVIHRDVKPGNVLIDADMNARLSDFGLARLYDHSEISHTTAVVGTVGYLSPELARTGKASKSTDVFAFGVLLLEMASGRRPLGSDQFILVDWVTECYELNLFQDAADERLNSLYDVHEMELVLQLGLLCSHQLPEVRPTMRNIMRYLQGDDPLPPIGDWIGISDAKSKVYEVKLNNLKTTSYRSSSVGAMTSSSLEAGR